MIEQIELSPFQQRCLLVPEEVDLFLGGGRGGGKSMTEALLCLRHAEQYDARARMLYLRKTYKGVADFELTTRDLFARVYGPAARYNSSEHVWRFPNGAYLELGQLESHADYGKYQGRSFTLLLVDEAGQFATPELLDIVRSNLRGPADVPLRMVLAANPGGVGHHWLAYRYVFRTRPWQPFREPKSKRLWAYAPSTFGDNPFIDQEQYADQLESSCPEDPELLKAWRTGDWTVARGAYFGSVIDEARNAIAPWDAVPRHWSRYLAHDFGSSAPSVTYVIAESPGEKGPDDRFYPRGSLVLVDELATHRRGNLAVGLGWTVPTLAEEIKQLWGRWNPRKMRTKGVADDAIFAKTGSGAGSIADEFTRAAVYFQPARKADRVSGWQRMRRLLADAGKPDAPGLYVSRNCAYWWATVPYLARDERRIEDVDSDGPDHGADACRYGCLGRPNVGSVERVPM